MSEIMVTSAPGGVSDYNSKIIEEFRADGGRVGGSCVGTTLILIHHIGAGSGIERVTPPGCFSRGRGPLRDRRLQRPIADPPGLVLQLKSQPQDHSRG